jgi:hypothetical protein
MVLFHLFPNKKKAPHLPLDYRNNFKYYFAIDLLHQQLFFQLY